MNTRQGILQAVIDNGSIITLNIETADGTASYFGHPRLTDQALAAMGLHSPDDLPARVTFTYDGALLHSIGLDDDDDENPE